MKYFWKKKQMISPTFLFIIPFIKKKLHFVTACDEKSQKFTM